MRSTPKKKLSLNIQTLRQLTRKESAEVVGAYPTYTCNTCWCTQTGCPTFCWACDTQDERICLTYDQ